MPYTKTARNLYGTVVIAFLLVTAARAVVGEHKGKDIIDDSVIQKEVEDFYASGEAEKVVKEVCKEKNLTKEQCDKLLDVAITPAQRK